MRRMVDIDFVLDEALTDPKVTVRAKEKSEQVEKIIAAIEKVSESDHPMIMCRDGEELEFVSQRDIVRVYTEKRKVIVETDTTSYSVDKTLGAVEEMLGSDRFVRISQSEIVNLFKVKSLNLSKSGTIGITFDNGSSTWVARSKVKAIKQMVEKT